MGMVFAPAINAGTFGVAPQDAGVASATLNVGQQLGASIGTSLLNSIFAAAVTAYLTAHLAAARLIGRQALTGQALAARLHHRVLVDRRDLRRRRGHLRRPAPQRAAGSAGHAVPSTRRGASAGAGRPRRAGYNPAGPGRHLA